MWTIFTRVWCGTRLVRRRTLFVFLFIFIIFFLLYGTAVKSSRQVRFKDCNSKLLIKKKDKYNKLKISCVPWRGRTFFLSFELKLKDVEGVHWEDLAFSMPGVYDWLPNMLAWCLDLDAYWAFKLGRNFIVDPAKAGGVVHTSWSESSWWSHKKRSLMRLIKMGNSGHLSSSCCYCNCYMSWEN